MPGGPAESASEDRRPLTWRVLTNERRFGVYFIGAGLSNIGNWCQTLAGILLIHRLTESVLLVGLASVVQFVWPILLGPWVGLAADRFDRRRVLMVTQSIAAVVSGALAVLTFTGAVSVGTALLAIAFLGILQAFQAPAQIALVPLLVDKADLEIGLSLSSSQFNLARAVGPMVASGLILWGGIGAPFLFNSLSFLAYLLLLQLLRPAGQDLPATPPRIRETVTTVLGSPLLLPLFGIGFVVSGSTDVVNTLGPAMSISLTGTDEWTGWFITAFGAGALLSAFCLVGLIQNVRRRLPWTIGVQAVGAAMFALATTPVVALVGAGLFGVGFILSSNRALSLVQRSVPPELTGRITAVWLMAFLGGRAFYALGSGLVADLTDPRSAAVLAAVTLVVAAVGAVFLGRRAER